MHQTKVCKTCGYEKPLKEYCIAKNNKQGVGTSCKICVNSKYVPTPLPQNIFFDKNTRICTVCKEEKDFNSFYKSNKEKSGVGQKCKNCHKDIRKISLSKPKVVRGTFKICGKCKISYPLDNYVKDNSKYDGLSSSCQSCVREYRENNKPLLRKLKRQYTLNNKERILEYGRTYTRERLLTDPLFKLKSNISRLIFQTFKNSKYQKKSKTVKVLGISMDKFKSHIESQFLSWMCWEKHGNCDTEDYNCSFDLDHIIPCSYAKNEEEVVLLNHWSNFQPLCSKTNRADKRATVYPCTNLVLRITFWKDHYECI